MLYEESTTNIWLLIFKKLPTVHKSPNGKNSPNLVTLPIKAAKTPSSKGTVNVLEKQTVRISIKDQNTIFDSKFSIRYFEFEILLESWITAKKT
jgi:hypothetical protein